MFSICFVLRIRGFDRLLRPPTQSAPPTQPLEAGRSRSRSRAGQLLPGASRSVAELSWRGGAVCVCVCVCDCVCDNDYSVSKPQGHLQPLLLDLGYKKQLPSQFDVILLLLTQPTCVAFCAVPTSVQFCSYIPTPFQ